jgi:hypothetical protein
MPSLPMCHCASENDKANSMRTTADPFDSKTVLDGIRSSVEIKTPTEVDGKGAHTHCEQMYISPIEPQARLLRRLYRTLR